MVTGSGGLVGSSLRLSLADYRVNFVSRKKTMDTDLTVDEIDGETDWAQALDDVDTVIHCAARVHNMNDSSDARDLYFRTNVEGTENLARQAASAGVKRFIFLSSVKVNGEHSRPEAPFSCQSLPQPVDIYAESKLRAEEVLKSICAKSHMEYVIIRPPLVYGPGVRANFLSMLKWVSRNVPLPFGRLDQNSRSLVYSENLCDLIRVCIHHPSAANEVLMVSDDEDVSTRKLLERLAIALGVEARLVNISPGVFDMLGALLGKKALSKRLGGSLEVDISHTKALLGWDPPFSMDYGLIQTAKWYKQVSSRSATA